MSFKSFASIVVLPLRSGLGMPSTKIPLDSVTLVSYILSSVVCYFMAVVLVVMPRTRITRLALSLLVVLLALRVALSVDMSHGGVAQASLKLLFPLITTRTLDWALVKGPLIRHSRPANSTPSTIMDALDLASNFRGIGWDWSRGLYIPRETRPANRITFVLYTFLSVIAHGLICGVLQRVVLALLPTRVGPIPEEQTVFDSTLPFFFRYLRAGTISVLAASMAYAAARMGYDLCTVTAILVLRQDPVQWPPIFDAPWRSTSLIDFWGRRWHQTIRRTLLQGGYPLSFILGRSGLVIGVFLASAVTHHIMLLALNSQIEFWWMLIGFGMMAPGVLAEIVFYQLTGRRVCGVVGWLWAMAWLLLWGTVIIEGFARAGLLGWMAHVVDSFLPAWVLPVGHSVADFDAWLHTI